MQNTVRNTVRIAALSALFAIGSGAAAALHAEEVTVSHAAAGSTLNRVEQRQMMEDFSPKAQYQRSRKEAHAAYAEALKECKGMGKSDRTACRQQAKRQMQNDLAYAKQQMDSDSNYGSSGTQGKAAAGKPAAGQPPANRASGGLIEDNGRAARARDRDEYASPGGQRY